MTSAEADAWTRDFNLFLNGCCGWQRATAR
jgi:hypothetical protein